MSDATESALHSASSPAVSSRPNSSNGAKTAKGKKRAIAKTKAEKRTRTVRSFPASTFEEALTIPLAIQRFAAGQRVRRLTLFHNLEKAPDSGPSRQLVINSAKYGLTVGGQHADYLELTELGKTATSADAPLADQFRARFQLAIMSVQPFKDLYENFKGNKIPALPVMRDFLVDKGYAEADNSECVDTFILNAKFLGLLRTIAGAERLLPIEHVLEELPRLTLHAVPAPLTEAISKVGVPASEATSDWTKICFYITPIGSDDSEERRHADLFLSAIVEPAVEEFGLKVVRADQIGKPGMITGQVIEHVVRSGLVIADLSFHNPNVFYELSLRHVCRLPTVQVIRASDRIPFDLDQFRTVKIDTSSIYTLVPQLDTYRAEIANQVRRALENPDAVDNPVTVFCPGLRVSFSEAKAAA